MGENIADGNLPQVLGDTYSGINVCGDARVHIGKSFKHQSITFNIESAPQPASNASEFGFKGPVGLCLDQAPYVQSEWIIGRDADLDQMRDILKPEENGKEHRRLVVGGTGGIGKTQLAIAYAKRYSHIYDSVFWLNAMSEATVKANMKSLAEQMFELRSYQSLSSDDLLVQVKRWFSDTKNTKWLLICDNYDEPKSYDLQKYFPYASHGTVIVTTRRPDLVGGHNVRLQPLGNIGHALRILETRSKRDHLKDDVHARRLAERLEGFPLALATAGAYLQSSPWTFEQYLDAYEKQWLVDTDRVRLSEYADRSLYTTWDLSYVRLQSADPTAARLLKLLAYFDNKGIQHDLLCAGAGYYQPSKSKRHRVKARLAKTLNIVSRQSIHEWVLESIADRGEFDRAMNTLVQYCFVEVQPNVQAYSMHTCVHDWTLAGLNRTVDGPSYWYAMDCVAGWISKQDWDAYSEIRCAWLTPHAARLTHHKFHEIEQEGLGLGSDNYHRIGGFLDVQGQSTLAIQMLQQLVRRRERRLGRDDILTLIALGSLAQVYVRRDMLIQAEKMYKRALDGFEKGSSVSNQLIPVALQNLGSLYLEQLRYEEAERYLTQALVGFEKMFGAEDPHTLNTVMCLGNLYRRQLRLDKAEQLFRRALVGLEKAHGREALIVCAVLHNFALVNHTQGKLTEAEEMYTRAVRCHAKTLRTDNPDRLNSMVRLGELYVEQDKLDEAQQMFDQVIATCRSSFNMPESPLFESVHCYARVLDASIRITGKASSFAQQQNLSTLIELFAHWGNRHFFATIYLAKVLIGFNDEENAKLAFVHLTKELQTGVLDAQPVGCIGCINRLSTACGLHFCLQCAYVYLCNACMAKYETGTLVWTSCHDHGFFNAGAIISQTLESPNTQADFDFDKWMARLKEKYRVVDNDGGI